MLITYTLYLIDSEGGRQFEPVLCDGPVGAIEQARALKSRRPGCAAVEVFFGEALVVRIE